VEMRTTGEGTNRQDAKVAKEEGEEVCYPLMSDLKSQLPSSFCGSELVRRNEVARATSAPLRSTSALPAGGSREIHRGENGSSLPRCEEGFIPSRMSGRGDGSLGGGDGTEGVRPQPWRVPWRRSVGFWLGLWVLAFLVWMWVDSFSNVSRVESLRYVRSEHVSTGETGWRVGLQRGRISYAGAVLHDAPRGTVSFKRPLTSLRHGGWGPR
jgi:hypothetical protein